MGVLIRVKSAGFESSAVAFIPPISDGLEYWNFFGGGASKAARNLASNKPGGVVVGNPVYGEHSAVFTGQSAYIQTGVEDSADMTLIAVAKPISDAGAHIVSSFSGQRANGATGVSLGKTLWFTNGGQDGDGLAQMVATQGRWSGVSGSASLSVTSGTLGLPINQWVAVTALMGATSNQIKNNSSGFVDTDTPTGVTDPSTLRLRVGSATVAGASSEIAFVAAYSRLLSMAEVDAIYAFLKKYYARRGIAI